MAWVGFGMHCSSLFSPRRLLLARPLTLPPDARAHTALTTSFRACAGRALWGAFRQRKWRSEDGVGRSDREHLSPGGGERSRSPIGPNLAVHSTFALDHVYACCAESPCFSTLCIHVPHRPLHRARPGSARVCSSWCWSRWDTPRAYFAPGHSAVTTCVTGLATCPLLCLTTAKAGCHHVSRHLGQWRMPQLCLHHCCAKHRAPGGANEYSKQQR